MLHWMYILMFFFGCTLLSMAFLNRSLLTLILISEMLLIILFLLCLLFCGAYNLYYLTGLGFVVLVLGGLELALNILIFLL